MIQLMEIGYKVRILRVVVLIVIMDFDHKVVDLDVKCVTYVNCGVSALGIR